jgi:hypothetical protein
MTTETDRQPRRVRLKFCGGCNPGYDRVALAEQIKSMAANDDGITLCNDDDPDLVIAICGCPTACANVSGFGGAQVVKVSSPEEITKIGL